NGLLWHEGPVVSRLNGLWCAFANEYEDGSFQYGHLAFGHPPFNYANIVDGDLHVSCPIEDIRITRKPNGFVSRIDYELANGETWEFVTEKNGDLIDQHLMGRRAGVNWFNHKGYTGKLGEVRQRMNWYSLQEVLPDRLGLERHAAELQLDRGPNETRLMF